MMNRLFLAVVLMLSLASVAAAKPADDAKVQDRLQNAGTVMHEILNMPESIPQGLLDKARCIIVLPSVLKAAFVVGGSYGRGVLICRTGPHFEGSWGAPAMYALEGGSIGFQIGGEATDFVVLVMNDRGANSLLHSKVKIGGDASAAAGPVGRTASADTDAYMRTEMLTYSRARGAFAGVSLEGSSLRPDGDANAELYGQGVTAGKIVTEHAFHAPPAADGLIHALDHASPKLVP
jgi:lipid-binding SYLF domain-containing protein